MSDVTTMSSERMGMNGGQAVVPQLVEQELGDTEGRLVIEPLERGYGTTLGNALRRVLLSSIPGAAVTRVRFSGKYHEYDTIPGVTETVLEIILNLKELAIRLTHGDGFHRTFLTAEEPGQVTAADLELPSGVEVINPDHHIATLDEGAELELELEIESGYGYRAAERNKREDMPLGVIAIDADFSPIKRVNYRVEETRVGERTDFDRLVLEIETHGGIQPSEALHEAAQILINHFRLFSDFTASHPFASTETESDAEDLDETLEDLGFDTRACNLLRSRGILTLRDLLSQTRDELLDINNFGEKSLVKVEEKLHELGYEINDPSNG